MLASFSNKQPGVFFYFRFQGNPPAGKLSAAPSGLKKSIDLWY